MILFTDKTKNLQNLLIQKSKYILCDELCIISGYVGIGPIELITETENLNVTLIYGLAFEGIQEKLLSQLQNIHQDLDKNITIYCPSIPSHAKLYLWKYKGEIVYGLNGSANFSSNGLLTLYRELLSEVNKEDFREFNDYFQTIYDSCIEITEVTPSKRIEKARLSINQTPFVEGFCTTDSLFGNGSKINWGFAPKGHTNPRDAYIGLRKQDIEQYPELFPPKSANNGLGRADNEPIDVIWDDGVSMVCLLEGSMEIDSVRYPNKISTLKSKKILGDYLRNRLGILPGIKVTEKDFARYGRNNITISKINEGSYYFDFSVKS
jgi:hypothetical protein